MERNIVCQCAPISLVGNDMLRIHGRHAETDGCLAFDWSNSGFSFAFVGNGFMLSLREYKADAPAYVKIIIDGTRRQRFAVVNGSEKLIIEGLPEKRHRVDIYRVTEGEEPLLFESLTLFGQGAMLRNPPFGSPRRIEFIGDSLTSGYGVLGSDKDPDYKTYQQDSTYSYAFLASELLDADSRYICISGKGIACNCEGNRNDVKAGEFCDYLTRKGGAVDDGWVPDVVVLSIGTNDVGGPAALSEFSEAAEALLVKTREKYPDAYIIWMYGMCNQFYSDQLKQVIKKANAADSKISFLFVESIDTQKNEYGANGHPNVRANARVSTLLFKKIRSVTGWKSNMPKPKDEEE